MSKIDLSQMNKVDPLKRMAEKESGREEFSPMDPPDPLNPPNSDTIPYEDFHPYLQKFLDEHKASKEHVKKFEEAVIAIQENGFKEELNKSLSDFYSFFDSKIMDHNFREEKVLFPVLQKRLLEKGEHSKSPERQTAVDILEDDHINIIQLGAVSFNLFALAPRLPDSKSGMMVLDAAIHQANELIELLNLHIFREENVVFPLAQKHLLIEELNSIAEE